MLLGIAHGLDQYGGTWVCCLQTKCFGEQICRSGWYTMGILTLMARLGICLGRCFSFLPYGTYGRVGMGVFRGKNLNPDLAKEVVNQVREFM